MRTQAPAARPIATSHAGPTEQVDQAQQSGNVEQATPGVEANAGQGPAADRYVDRMEGVSAPQPTTAEKNAKLMTDFYDAFARHDGKAMAAMYHEDAVFHDPAFGTLKGKEIGAMWMMLTESAPTLKVRSSNIKGDAKGASGHWDADYNFSATGRDVRNSIDARFEIKDGKIFRHKDDFSFEKWALQALPAFDKLGWLGRKMAGSGLLQGGLQHFARKGLEDYMEKNGI